MNHIRKLLIGVLLALSWLPSAHAQISGAGQLSCSGATVTGTAATSGTSNNTVLASFTSTPAYGVLVQLDQTSTISGGAITFQVSYDGGANFITVPVAQVLNPSTGARLTNPYTLVASTNQSFLVILSGASSFQVKLTTTITGSATVTPFLTAICTAPTIGPLLLDASGNLLININAQSLAKILVTPDSVALPANQSVNISQMNGVTTSMGNGTTDTGTQRVSLSSDSTGQVVPSPTTASGDAVSACNILSTASTNSTSCKGSAGNFYGYEIYNNTTTIYYLRLYNSSAAPTCSSATGFIRTIPIPPAGASGQASGAISNQTFPVNYGTGIGYCITGGSTSTDNTNAAAGVFGEIRYK